MYDTDLQSSTFQNFAPLIALFFLSNTSRFQSKNKLKNTEKRNSPQGISSPVSVSCSQRSLSRDHRSTKQLDQTTTRVHTRAPSWTAEIEIRSAQPEEIISSKMNIISKWNHSIRPPHNTYIALKQRQRSDHSNIKVHIFDIKELFQVVKNREWTYKNIELSKHTTGLNRLKI